MADEWEGGGQAAGEWEGGGGEAPITGAGAYRAFEEVAQRGVAGAAALPSLIERGARAADPYVQSAGNWLVNKLGLPESMRPQREGRAATVQWPSYEQEREAIRRDFGGLPEYEPQNRAERLLTAAGEQLPNVVGPGGLLRGAAQALVPGAAVGATRELGGGPMAEAAAGFAGSTGLARIGSRIERATLAPELVKEAAQRNYRAVEQAALGEILTPLQAGSVHATIGRELANRGFHSGVTGVPEVYGILEDLKGAPNMNRFMTVRRALGNVGGGPERIAAQEARNMVDTALETRIPGSVRALQEADQNYNAFKTAEELSKALEKGELQTAATHSGMNLGNKLRQIATSIVSNEKRTRYMQPGERAALEQLARGTWTQTGLRYVSNLLGGGGGLGALAASAYGGHLLAPGIGALAAPLTGMAARQLYNRSIAAQAARLPQLALARSPEAIARGITLPQGGARMPYRGLLSGYLGYEGGQQ